MIVSKVHISNFRCFEDLTLEFDERLTILAGVNGSGKSAVLDAVTIAVGTLTSELDMTRYGIAREDAREVCYELGSGADVQAQYPVSIKATGLIGGQQVGWTRLRRSRNGHNILVDAERFREIAQDHSRRIAAGDSSLILPLISYYGTGRLWAQKREKQNAPLEKTSRQNGYLDSLDAAANNKLMMKWFAKMTMRGMQTGRLSPEFVVVRQVVSAFVTRLTGGSDAAVYYNLDKQEIEVDYSAQDGSRVVISLNKLSDGYKSAICLIADIAYRMAMLNPQLLDKVVDETPGVVLIDEIDLHLHPAWQQRILSDLLRIFPKVQFIISTHAPSVLNSCPCGKLLLLENGSLKREETQPYGMDANSVLTGVMGVSSRPDEIEQAFKKFHRLLDAEKYDEAGQCLDALAAILGEFDPDLTACRMSLRLEQMH